MNKSQHGTRTPQLMRVKTAICASVVVIVAVGSQYANATRAADPATAESNTREIEATLDSGEHVVNNDGAKESPNDHLSAIARAYQSGLVAGREAQAKADAKARASSRADSGPLPSHFKNAQVRMAPPSPMPEQFPRAVPAQPQYAQYAPPAFPPQGATNYAGPVAPEMEPPPGYVQPVYVQRAYSPPQPPVQYAPVYTQPQYVPVQPVMAQPVFPVVPVGYYYGGGRPGWGGGYRGWRGGFRR